VITRVNDVGIDEKNIPFLPVIPQGYRSFHDQMNTVFSGGYRGESRITPHLVVDLEETPADPYFIFDVDVGTSLRGKPPNVARRIIEGRGRLSLTGVEAIAIPLFATSMPECFLHATGSYYCSRAKVLTVHWFKTCADLGWTLGKDRHPEWGTPSCAARF
jgi:hypothetical protein